MSERVLHIEEEVVVLLTFTLVFIPSYHRLRLASAGVRVACFWEKSFKLIVLSSALMVLLLRVPALSTSHISSSTHVVVFFLCELVALLVRTKV